MTEQMKELLEKSERSIAAAKLLVNDDYYDFAASRAYYAMFYAVEALLLSINCEFSKHSAVISAFGKEFVKTGMIEVRFHRAIIDAFDLRNAGDYGNTNEVTNELARKTIEDAASLLAEVKRFFASERKRTC